MAEITEIYDYENKKLGKLSIVHRSQLFVNGVSSVHYLNVFPKFTEDSLCQFVSESGFEGMSYGNATFWNGRDFDENITLDWLNINEKKQRQGIGSDLIVAGALLTRTYGYETMIVESTKSAYPFYTGEKSGLGFSFVRTDQDFQPYEKNNTEELIVPVSHLLKRPFGHIQRNHKLSQLACTLSGGTGQSKDFMI